MYVSVCLGYFSTAMKRHHNQSSFSGLDRIHDYQADRHGARTVAENLHPHQQAGGRELTSNWIGPLKPQIPYQVTHHLQQDLSPNPS